MSAMHRLSDLWRGVKPLPGKRRPADSDPTGERAQRFYGLGQPVLQSAEEQAGVRSRMVAELDAQRQRRVLANKPQSATAPPLSSGWVSSPARLDEKAETNGS
jgi:hypothetical protein